MAETEEEKLIETLRKVETLYARATIPGERTAAANAAERIRERLKAFEQKEQPVEFRFSITDPWSRTLFLALLRRYELKPYRRWGQRRTSVMVRVTKSFVDEVLWPEYQEIEKILREHLHSVTQRIITQAIHGDQTDAEERPDGPEGSQLLP
jgi:hypothetical protein